MPTIKIAVKNKVAHSTNDIIVCGNNDYVIEFEFDEEWGAYSVKTARFMYDGKYEDVVFGGNKVVAPVLRNTATVAIGVYAGDLRTTTPALLSCDKSILCENGTPADPSPEVYAQLMEIFKAGRIYKVDINETGHLIVTLENGEEFDAGYCGDSGGTGGGSIDIDQTYTPDSENAQSGKAVAEAIGTIEATTRETVYIGMDGYCYKKDGTKYSIREIFTMPPATEFSVYAREFVNKYDFVLLYNYGKNAEEALYSLDANVIEEGEIFFSAIVVNGSEIIAHSIVQFTGLYIDGDETISVNAYPIAGEFLTFADGFLNVDKFALLGNIGNMTMKEYTDQQVGNTEAALDEIIAIQNKLIGGEGA